MDGQRYRTNDDLLRHEGADTGIVPAGGVYPLHTDVHHGGHLLGPLATVGEAGMGVAQGLGVPMPVAAGAVCTGAFFGDKVSSLSDSPVITATVCDVPLMEGLRHALISTGPAYLISLIFFFVYGLRYAGGTVGGEVYEDILSTVSASFWFSPVLLIPVAVVVVLILMKKPTIPTFMVGIALGALLTMVCQGVGLKDILTVMYSGFSVDSGSEVVNSMLNRGGFTSMLSTIGLLIAAGIFGAPLRTAGVVDVLLAFVRKIAKNAQSMSLGVLILHAVFFTITGAYYVSYPVVGGMVKDLYPKYHLDRKNLMRTLLDTGTGLGAAWCPGPPPAPIRPPRWVSGNLAFLPYAPMLWLSIVFSVIYAVIGHRHRARRRRKTDIMERILQRWYDMIAIRSVNGHEAAMAQRGLRGKRPAGARHGPALQLF